ncbi:lipopolysaccharide biosynthesis protein [Flavobacterium sp. ZB4R12]|uniref:lipopolysaccharide biosynthesis protein n=1 Tax=Flavobacterium sp. ZB4R12 TaxID=3398732 RepID=UPI003AAC8547
MQFKNVFINIGSSYAHIVLSVFMNIMYIPIALHYLGVERYGVWIVLQTFVNFLTMANFGIPTAVTNLMCQSDNYIEKCDILIKGFKILLLICFVLFLFSLISFFTILHLTSWLNSLTYEMKTSSLILIVFFILRIPFQISSAAFIADNKIYVAKIYEFLTIFITFLSLLALVYFKQNLIFLAVLSGILLLILNSVSFLNALKILGIKNCQKSPKPIEARAIYRPGLALFASGMGAIIVWNTDNIIISKFLGFQEVAIYSTAFRLFSFAYMTFGLIYGVFIPYYGKFFGQKDWGKLQNFFNFNIIVIPFIAICVWLVGWLFARDIIFLWLGDYKLYAGSHLYFVLGAYGLVLAYVGVMFNLLTSLNLVKGLVYVTVIEAIVNLLLSVFFVQILGAEGVALGTLIGSISGPLVFLPFLINKNKKLELSFPLNKFIISLFFYVIMLLSLYLLNANEYRLFWKILIVFIYISLFLLFQFLLNKKLFKDIFQLFKMQ